MIHYITFQQATIVIHHHATAYVDEQAVIWLPAFIGRWVNAIAQHCCEVRLLLYKTDQRTPRQDTSVSMPNVCLYSLGKPGKTWDRITRMRQLRRVCSEAAEGADGLVIRGITPRQHAVWKSTPIQNKAFMLVGSLSGELPPLRPSFKSIYSWVMAQQRPKEVHAMAKDGVTLLANSPLLVDELHQYTNHPVQFIPTNSLSSAEFPPLRPRMINPTPRLLYCGRIVLEKGVSELIQALALPGAEDYQLDMVGPVGNHERTYLSQLAQKMGVSHRIHWHGLVKYGEYLFKFYRQSGFFVLPTYTEGFPHVIWEAAAHSCPVITTAVGGIPALWKHEQHGILIEPKNRQDIVNAIECLRWDNTLRKRLVMAAYHHALDYTVEVCVQKLVDYLSEEWHLPQ